MALVAPSAVGSAGGVSSCGMVGGGVNGFSGGGGGIGSGDALGLGAAVSDSSAAQAVAQDRTGMMRDLEKLDTYFKSQSAEMIKLSSELMVKRREVCELRDSNKNLKDESRQFEELLSNQTAVATQERLKASVAEKSAAEAKAAEKRAIDEVAATRNEREGKLRETLHLKQQVEEATKLRNHFEKLSQQKDQDLKAARSDLKDTFSKQHDVALRQKDEEHKAEIERLKKEFEDAIVDLTVQNYGAQAGSNSEALKATCATLREEIKSLKAQLATVQAAGTSAARKVRFEESPQPPAPKPGSKRKPTRSTPVPGGGGGGGSSRKKAKASVVHQFQDLPIGTGAGQLPLPPLPPNAPAAAPPPLFDDDIEDTPVS